MTLLRIVNTALVGSFALFSIGSALPTAGAENPPQNLSNIPAELLAQQAAYWANKFIRDPVTNHTIPNPAYADHQAGGNLAKRNYFDPVPGPGDECRISANHFYYPTLTCSPGHGCDDNSFETQELRIEDHHNPDTAYAVFQMENGQNQYFQIDGHRGWQGAAGWGDFQRYGLSWAWGNIEGRGDYRGTYSP